jgi:hypothetical protein
MHQRSSPVLLGLIVAVVVLVTAMAVGAQEVRQGPHGSITPPPPNSRPNPAGQRACTTAYGLCRIADGTPPGQPCYCHYANGQWVGGFSREWNWEFKPFDTK